MIKYGALFYYRLYLEIVPRRDKSYRELSRFENSPASTNCKGYHGKSLRPISLLPLIIVALMNLRASRACENSFTVSPVKTVPPGLFYPPSNWKVSSMPDAISRSDRVRNEAHTRNGLTGTMAISYKYLHKLRIEKPWCKAFVRAQIVYIADYTFILCVHMTINKRRSTHGYVLLMRGRDTLTVDLRYVEYSLGKFLISRRFVLIYGSG